MKRALRAAFGALGRYGSVRRLSKPLDVAAPCSAELLHQAEQARRHEGRGMAMVWLFLLSHRRAVECLTVAGATAVAA